MRGMRILGLVGLLGIAGCAGAPRPSAPPERPAAAESTPTLPPARAVSLQLPTAGDEDYRLAAKDQISVTVFGQKDLTRTLRVSQSGTITMPLLGEVKAGGLSPAELERKIEDGLRGRYLVNPRVTVAVAEYQGRQVAVVGAVNQPGAYLLKANHTTVLNALSEANGVKDGADRIAYVVRARPRPGEPQPVMVYLDMLLRQAHPAYNVVVEPGDSISVPPANIYDVAGRSRSGAPSCSAGRRRSPGPSPRRAE
jgi:protein involved in polysaccharide export with SLBB domain